MKEINAVAWDEAQAVNDVLLGALQSDGYYRPQLDRILEAGDGDIDGSFLGFVSQYYYLAKLVPLDRVIYDLGCAYGPQSWYFRNHHKYIAVDLSNNVILPPNGEFYQMTIKEFLDSHTIEQPHFAICSYVPPWHNDNEALVRGAFKHLFVYYP